MIIRIASPCSLALGLARWPGGGLAWLGITLRHPPVAIDAWPAARLGITGGRADLGHAQAERVMQRLSLPPAEMECEFAIPRHMGLGSEAMHGLTVAQALALVVEHPVANDTPALANALGLGRGDELAMWGFSGGGLLLVRADAAPREWPAPLRRFELTHEDEQAWGWSLHWPPNPPNIAPNLEAERTAQLLAAAPHLSEETGRLVDDQLWPAVERDDIAAFGQALMALQQINRAALDAARDGATAGTPAAGAPGTQSVLDVLRDNGAAAWGESAVGLVRFGLLRGASASVALRAAVRDHIGIEGGTVMASICDNKGARHLVVTDGA